MTLCFLFVVGAAMVPIAASGDVMIYEKDILLCDELMLEWLRLARARWTRKTRPDGGRGRGSCV